MKGMMMMVRRRRRSEGGGGGRRYRIGYGMGGRYGHGYKREKGIAEGRRAGGQAERLGKPSVDENRSTS